jgi:hypothetical protein
VSQSVFYSRKFLNTKKEGGIALVEGYVNELTERTSSFDAELKIGDCNRIVTLDFACYSKEATTNLRQKIVALRRVVVAFEAALIAQLNQVDKEKAD